MLTQIRINETSKKSWVCVFSSPECHTQMDTTRVIGPWYAIIVDSVAFSTCLLYGLVMECGGGYGCGLVASGGGVLAESPKFTDLVCLAHLLLCR